MIRETLVFLRDELNAYLNEQAGRPTDSPEYMAVFVDSQDTQRDVIAFPPNAVTVMLINVEEERALRAPDRYRQRLSNGNQQQVQPDIKLNLYVLFVTNFTQYEESLRG